VESENQAKLAIEEQSKKKYDEKYKDVRQDKMKYFNALQGRQQNIYRT
jgi:peptidylprolyl isomerase